MCIRDRFSVVQDFCGHGIGRHFHQEPNVLHYGERGTGEKIKTINDPRPRIMVLSQVKISHPLII